MNQVELYDARYQDGYMEAWPDSKRDRVKALIMELELPIFGRALDAGCGNGVFTEVLREALPGWEIHGAEISPTAVENARVDFPNCHFHLFTDPTFQELRFDLVFTHHVLEHVQDIRLFLSQLSSLLQPTGSQLHIAPCGNPGSFEDLICQMTEDSIQATGKRFYEESGHLRRLTSKQVEDVLALHGIYLHESRFLAHFWGSLAWISSLQRADVAILCDPARAKNKTVQKELILLRRGLLLLTFARLPLVTFKTLKTRAKTPFEWIKFISAIVCYLPASLIENILLTMEQREWEQSCYSQNGSEMYLYFRRILA